MSVTADNSNVYSRRAGVGLTSQTMVAQKSSLLNQKQAEFTQGVDIYLPPISNNVDNYIQQRKNFAKASSQSSRTLLKPSNYRSEDFSSAQPMIQDMLVHTQEPRRDSTLIVTPSDVAQKVRDLQLQMIDMQGNQDRRLSILNEQLNAKIERALANLEAKQNNQQSQIQAQAQFEQMGFLKTQLQQQVQQLSEHVILLSAKHEEFEMRVGSMQRTVQNLQENQNSLAEAQTHHQKNTQSNLNLLELEADVKFLRNSVQEERVKRESTHLEQAQFLHQLQQQIHAQEVVFQSRFKEAIEHQMSFFKDTNGNQLQKDQRIMEKLEQANEVMRSVVQNLDRRVESETANRTKNEDELRQWFSTQLQILKQGQQLEGGATLDREKQMMAQLNAGLAQISEVVKTVKSQSAAQLKDISQNTIEGVTESVSRVNSISDAIKAKQAILEGTLSDLVSKMDTLQEQAIKHARMTNDTLSKEVTRIEKVMSTLESFTKMQVGELRKEITSVRQETDRWTVNFEDLHSRKIMEIHQAIKVLNQNATFIQKDANEKFELLQGQSANSTSLLTTQLKDIKLFVKNNHTLQEPQSSKNIGSTLLAQPRLSSVDTKDIDEKLARLKRECEARSIEIANTQVRKVLAEREQAELLIEGRANQFTVDTETKIQQQLNVFKKTLIEGEQDRQEKLERVTLEANQIIEKMRKEYQENYRPLMQLEAEILKKVQTEVTRQVEARIDQKNYAGDVRVGVSAVGDGELRQLKDKTQTEYIDTLFNTLRLQLMKEVKDSRVGEDGIDVRDELNSHDLSIKQINLRMDGLLGEFKKLDRVHRQTQSHIQLEITEQADKLTKIEKQITNDSMSPRKIDSPRGEVNETTDQLQRIRIVERGLQKLENKIMEQQAGLDSRVKLLENESEITKQAVTSTNMLVQRLDQPFKDMREVLIEVTKTLSEMEEREMMNDGTAGSGKSRMSFANKKMLDSARSQDANLKIPQKK